MNVYDHLLLCRKSFKNPENMESDAESDLEIQGGEYDNGVVFAGFADVDEEDDVELASDDELFDFANAENNDFNENDHDQDDEDFDEDTDSDSDTDMEDSDEDIIDENTKNGGRREGDDNEAGASGSGERSGGNDGADGDDDDDEEEDVIRKILENTKTPRTHPPDINIDDYVVDLSFHPDNDIVAVATMSGDAILYKYSVDECKLVETLELHTKAIRDIEFSVDGNVMYSTAKDKTILLTDVATGKFKRLYEQAHKQPVSFLYVIDENMIATGDDDGCIKCWDGRDNTSSPIFSLKEVDDYITSMVTNDAKKILVATSSDGYLTALNIASRKLYVQSEPYDEELTCCGLFRNDSKLVVGTSKGRLYTYNWNEFGYHSNMYPGPKTPMSHMIPVTDRVAVVAGEEGVLRAMHCIPGRNLGVVGQHSLAVDAMDINHSGEYIASTCDNNEVKFWNIKYFEELDDNKYHVKQNKFKEQKHNLPSSKMGNVGDFFSDLL